MYLLLLLIIHHQFFLSLRRINFEENESNNDRMMFILIDGWCSALQLFFFHVEKNDKDGSDSGRSILRQNFEVYFNSRFFIHTPRYLLSQFSSQDHVVRNDLSSTNEKKQ